MPRGSALLTIRPRLVPFSAPASLSLFLLLAPFGAAACRSAAAPPPTGDAGSRAEPSGVLGGRGFEGTPCQPHQCPVPDDVLSDLGRSVEARLRGARQALADGLQRLEVQRRALLQALGERLGSQGRARDAARQRAGASADPTVRERLDFGVRAHEAAAWAFEDLRVWLTAVPDSPAPASTDGAAGTPPGAGRARPGNAEGGRPAEGQWILPVVRMLATVRAQVTEVSVRSSETETRVRELRTAEERLGAARGRLETLARGLELRVVLAPARAPARRAVVRPTPEETAAETARDEALGEARQAFAEAIADVDEVLASLERSRHPACPRTPGSAVCVPPPVAAWTGAEFLVPPANPAEVDALLRLVDVLMGAAQDLYPGERRP